MNEKFLQAFSLDVTDKVETRVDKNSGLELSYLSWAWAWAEFKKIYPEAQYVVNKFFNKDGEQLPYMYDEKTGYMVSTEIQADDITYEMWLPVMNNSNKAMKSEPYTYKTKSGVKNVEAATMFDVNKAIMRCLVKNMAMFGLGLYIYAGEDLPEKTPDDDNKPQQENKTVSLEDLIKQCNKYEGLKTLYRANKAEITKNKQLLDLVTKRSKELKETA